VITSSDFPSHYQTLLVFRWCGNNIIAVQKKKIIYFIFCFLFVDLLSMKIIEIVVLFDSVLQRWKGGWLIPTLKRGD
jgi:hypothetical protein